MKRMLSLLALLVLLAVMGRFTKGVDSIDTAGIGERVGSSYNALQRDSIIRNKQNRIKDDEACRAYKERFHRAGQRHESAASGSFVADMQGVMKAASRVGCLKNQNRSESYVSAQLDRSIRTWQTRISDDPRCADFKDAIRREAIDQASPARGSFAAAMRKVVDKARENGCEFVP